MAPALDLYPLYKRISMLNRKKDMQRETLKKQEVDQKGRQEGFTRRGGGGGYYPVISIANPPYNHQNKNSVTTI